MSKKKPSFVIRCKLCDREYEFTGGRSIWKPASPKIKGGFEYYEYVCKGCGTIMRVGGFIKNEEKKTES